MCSMSRVFDTEVKKSLSDQIRVEKWADEAGTGVFQHPLVLLLVRSIRVILSAKLALPLSANGPFGFDVIEETPLAAS